MIPNSFPCYFGKLGYHNINEEHELITERLRKTLYYGKNPTTDRPSLPLTEIAVEFFNEGAPRKLGKLDTYMASSSSRQTCMSPCSLMMGMLYIKRLRRHNMDYLQNVSSSDLFLISVMMASKFIYDEGVDDEVFNDEWAAAADMETEDVNELERQFLSAIDWNLFVSNEEFARMLTEIEKRIAFGQGLDRGWFSYTDIWILTQDHKFLKLFNDVSREMMKVIIVSTAAYAAGILVMVGSTVLVTCLSTTLASIGPVFVSKPIQMPVTGPRPVEEENCTGNVVSECNIDTSSKDAHSLGQNFEPEMERISKISEQKENTANTDGILSQLLAVITLRDSYLDFLLAVRDRCIFSSDKRLAGKQNNDEVLCADGPCLQNARINCQNVTNNADHLSMYKNSYCHNCLHRKRSQVKINQHARYSNGQSSSLRFESNFINNYGANVLGDSGGIQCCCNVLNYRKQEMLDPGALQETFSDISLGFMTGSHNTPWPILVHT